jgi:hypothetical protein
MQKEPAETFLMVQSVVYEKLVFDIKETLPWHSATVF